MKRLTIAPLHRSRLPDLHEVSPLDDDDVSCMAELRDLLARHGRLERFALHLAHRNFDLDHDEVLVEYSDPQRREKWQRVTSRAHAARLDAVPTTWMLTAVKPVAVRVCVYLTGRGHLGRHRPA